jgi:SSS family solute:Na+ symporter
VLGILLVGFYIKFVKAQAIFIGAVLSQLTIFYIYYLDVVSFLWLNFIGAMLTIMLSSILQNVIGNKREKEM